MQRSERRVCDLLKAAPMGSSQVASASEAQPDETEAPDGDPEQAPRAPAQGREVRVSSRFEEKLKQLRVRDPRACATIEGQAKLLEWDWVAGARALPRAYRKSGARWSARVVTFGGSEFLMIAWPQGDTLLLDEIAQDDAALSQDVEAAEPTASRPLRDVVPTDFFTTEELAELRSAAPTEAAWEFVEDAVP